MTFKSGLTSVIAVAAALSASAAWATHGRGGAVVPEVDASGMLTFDLISYWDPTGISEPSAVSFSITGPGGAVSGVASTSKVSDFSDSRREEHIYGASTQLSGAGLYTISWSDCCTANGIINDGNGNFGSTSSIYWDGSTANAPILFDLENIQQEVVRGADYSDNLDAIGGAGVTLTYGDSPANPTQGVNGITPPGYAVDGTGQITIDAASTAAYGDNASNPSGGADYLFTGLITGTDGTGQEQGSIEFFWLFDAVDSTGPANRAPTVSDIIVNAVVGDTIMETVTATDPDGDTVTLTLDDFIGAGVDVSDLTFDPLTGELVWDTTGFGPGVYIATIEGSDGSLSDIGSVRINLTNPNVIPLPAGAWLILSGLAGFGVLRRFGKRRA